MVLKADATSSTFYATKVWSGDCASSRGFNAL